MFRSKIIPIEKIGELIADDAVVTVSSSSGLGCPDASLRSIGKYFLEKGKPRGITAIHPIAAGDMYGIPGVDHIAHPGLLKGSLQALSQAVPPTCRAPRSGK
jgi:acyl CoA:acetate/3-ketoacid CoA transferase